MTMNNTTFLDEARKQGPAVFGCGKSKWSPSGPYICTLDRDHTGTHVAHLLRRNSEELIAAAWRPDDEWATEL